MNWYNFLSGDLAADFNQEHISRELVNVETAFKLYSIHNKKDVYKFYFNVVKKELKILRTVISQNFKFSSTLSFDTQLKDTEFKEHDPYIYHSAETYIIGYTLDDISYSFTIFTLNIRTMEVLSKKFEEALKMDEALK